MPINNSIINQKGTPAFYSDIFANRPAFGYAGRVFISTDTGQIFEDTGTSWTLIADAGAGTIGTLQQVTTNGNTTTLGVTIQGIDINDGAGTGTENTAIGKSSLVNNTTGINNTALGSYSLGFNTTGNNNTALGVSSLITNTTGANNVAIGNGALGTNTIGNNNTAIGFQPLYANTTGIGNVAIGNGALGTNTTGSNNTSLGLNSLSNNTTGQLNTTIGYNSGSAITTGSNNTIIGSYAGTTTLASNIVLSDGAGNVRLFSDANGLIGINQAVGSTIGGQLDIHTAQTYALVLNGLTTSNAYTAFSNNNVGQWRIGNTYNAGANTFDIFNFGTSSNALSFNKTTNNATFLANVTASSLIKSGGTSAQILAADGSVITAGTNITISGGTIASSGGGGSITLSAIGSTPNANAATITGSVLNLQPASASFGGVVTTGTQTFEGTKTFSAVTVTGDLLVGTGVGASDAKMEIGAGRTASGNAYIDLIADNTTYTDYGFRILRNSGANGITNIATRGTGNFQIATTEAAAILFTTSSVERLRVLSGGSVTIGNIAATGSMFQVNGSAAIGYSASTAAPTNGLSVAGTTNIGTNTSVTTALLQLSSTTQGFLPPVMTTTQKNAITTPATGLVVFDTTLGKLCVFSSTWQTITSV
jgi:hypothetical protein